MEKFAHELIPGDVYDPLEIVIEPDLNQQILFAQETFDARYVLDDGDRYLLYYSARDWGNLYRAGDGTIQHDGWGIYRHIGVAVCEKP